MRQTDKRELQHEHGMCNEWLESISAMRVPACVCMCVCVESIKQSYVVMMATNARECASAWATSGQITVLATVGGTRIMGMDKAQGTRDAP